MHLRVTTSLPSGISCGNSSPVLWSKFWSKRNSQSFGLLFLFGVLKRHYHLAQVFLFMNSCYVSTFLIMSVWCAHIICLFNVIHILQLIAFIFTSVYPHICRSRARNRWRTNVFMCVVWMHLQMTISLPSAIGCGNALSVLWSKFWSKRNICSFDLLFLFCLKTHYHLYTGVFVHEFLLCIDVFDHVCVHAPT